MSKIPSSSYRILPFTPNQCFYNELSGPELCGMLPVHLAVEVKFSAVDADRRHRNPKPSYSVYVLRAIGLHLSEAIREDPYLLAGLIGIFRMRMLVHREPTALVAVERRLGREDVVLTGKLPPPHALSLEELTDRMRNWSRDDLKSQPALRAMRRIMLLPAWLRRLVLCVGRHVPSLRARHRGSFLFSSVGKYGPDLQLPPWSSTALSFCLGKVKPRCVPVAGRPEVRRTGFLGVTFDRRILNGAPVARMLDRVRDTLERCGPGEPKAIHPGISSRLAVGPDARIPAGHSSEQAVGERSL